EREGGRVRESRGEAKLVLAEHVPLALAVDAEAAGGAAACDERHGRDRLDVLFGRAGNVGAARVAARVVREHRLATRDGEAGKTLAHTHREAGGVRLEGPPDDERLEHLLG